MLFEFHRILNKKRIKLGEVQMLSKSRKGMKYDSKIDKNSKQQINLRGINS
jgi:hypothetical protein